MKMRALGRRYAWFLIIAGQLVSYSGRAEEKVVPLIRAHAHNDYEHARPLLDALDNGFCSVEADIYLVNGKLLVAHDIRNVKPERTLQALYLDPLRARVKANGGRVYPGGPVCTLLIDVKSRGEDVYPVLREVLREYKDIFTEFDHGKMREGALTAVISGSTPRDLIAADEVRYAAIDGRPKDLEGNAPKELIPLMSESWASLFSWRGTDSIPDVQKKKLKAIVETAHAQGRRVRFWATPDKPEFWKELLADGVDLINADDLVGLRKFLLSQPKQ